MHNPLNIQNIYAIMDFAKQIFAASNNCCKAERSAHES